MASIMKRGDSYSVRYKYKDHSGKPCEGWESFKTRKEAQERKITVEKELLDGTFLVPDTITVEEMLYKWIPIQSTKHKWSPKTYTQSVAMVQNLIVPYIGNRKVQELRTYDIEKFYATLAKTPCGQYVHGVKQKLSDKQKKRLLSSTSIHEVHTLLKTAFSYAVEWDLIHKIPLPRDAPKVNIEERTIWDEKTMLAALQTIETPALHLAVHMSMILSLREGEILGLQPSDLDFDSADGRGTISVNKTMQRANKDALEKLDPKQVYYTFPDRREGSKFCMRSQCACRGTPAPCRSAARPARWSACPHRKSPWTLPCGCPAAPVRPAFASPVPILRHRHFSFSKAARHTRPFPPCRCSGQSHP